MAPHTIPSVATMPDPPFGPSALAERRTANTSAPVFAPKSEWKEHFLVAAPILGTTIFSKLSIPPLGSIGIGLAVPLAATVLGAQLLRGKAAIHPERLALFLVGIFVFSGLPLLHGDPFSLASMAMLIVLYLPLAFYFPDTPVSFEAAGEVVLWICRLIALLGVAQYLLQSFVPHEILFPMEYFVPESLRVGLFANEGPLAYGREEYRSNGVFMLEPSYFSQLMALGMIVELSTRNRIAQVLLYLAGLFVSYSGTGIIALAVSLPALIVTKKRWDLLILAALVGVVLASFAPYLNLDVFLRRSGELTSSGSSGYARFVGGFWVFHEFSLDSLYRTLFGFGPGTMREFINQSAYPSAEMALFKSLLEFGLVGTALFLGFVLWNVFANSTPLAIKLLLTALFFLGGSFTPFFHGVALSLVLWTRIGVPSSQRNGESS